MTDFHHEFLDCATALERLESVWPEDLSDASLDAELTPAWEHVQACSTCWYTLRQRRESDQQLADAMQSVPVPVGSQQRLLAQLSSAAAADGWHAQNEVLGVGLETASENVSESGPRHALPDGQDLPHKTSAVTLRRRAWMLAAAATLLIGVASGSWLWFAAQTSQVSIQTICEQTPLEAGDLPVASDPSGLPPSWLRAKGLGLHIVDKPRLFTPSNSKAIATWIPFEVRLPKQPVIRGVLVAAPRGNIVDPPAELILGATRLGYAHRDGHPVAVWSEGGVVYVCFVRGEAASLEWLLRQTEPTPA
jgi:hypothetical protein